MLVNDRVMGKVCVRVGALTIYSSGSPLSAMKFFSSFLFVLSSMTAMITGGRFIVPPTGTV